MAALAALAFTAPPGAAPALAQARANSGPTLAREDTMRTELPPQFVRAPRITLEDILDRVAQGEAHRDSLIRDQAFTATFRLVRNSVDKKKRAEVFSETIVRVYKKRPDKSRSVVLKEWSLEPEKDDDDDGVNVSFRSQTDEEIVNFAFRPENRRAYKFKIVGRDWLGGNRLIYRIEFEPRSALDFEHPSGLVWVDTNEFVIVRQELNYSRSPVPVILRGVDRMVVERERVDGIWVLRRVLLRARFTVPIPKIGSSMDLVLRFDDYAINRGIDDSVFAPAGGSK